MTLITGELHDGVEVMMAVERARKAREISLLPNVWWRFDPKVQFRALITKVWSEQLVDLLVIPDAYTSLEGARPGEPVPMHGVTRGTAPHTWSVELDGAPAVSPAPPCSCGYSSCDKCHPFG